MEPIRRVAIVGAGNMGSGIAQKSAQEGFSVQMIDREEGYVERGINTIKEFCKRPYRGGFSLKAKLRRSWQTSLE